MRTRILTTLAALLCLSAAAYGKSPPPVQLTVADPFIELHTGPGRGYPVFFVAERGEQVQVLMRRTDWFQVRTSGGKQGWVNEDQLARTLDPEGRPPDLGKATWDDFARHRWEVSVELGDYGGASEVVGTVGYRFTPNFTGEFAIADVAGRFSSDLTAALHLLNTPFPEWRVTPFVMLEGGVVHTSPNATIVSTKDRTDAFAGAGAGLRAYVTRRFIVRAEYSGYVIFTSRNDNERVEEWKAGFTYFF
jgi:hypothetical protein